MKNTLTCLIAAILGVTACHRQQAVKPVDFAAEVKPLLQSRCINCHSSGALFGELNLENHDMAFKSRTEGPVIVTGAPEKSRLYLVLAMPVTESKAMPPVGHHVAPEDVELIRRWISEGAFWPKGSEGRIEPPVQTKLPRV